MFSLQAVNSFRCENTVITDNDLAIMFKFDQFQGQFKGLKIFRNRYTKDKRSTFVRVIETGLIILMKSRLAINESKVKENHFKNYIDATDGSEVILRKTTFQGNTNEEGGELIKLRASNANIDNVVLALHRKWNYFDEQYQPSLNFMTPGFTVHSLTINTEKSHQDSNVVFMFLKTDRLKSMNVNCNYSSWPKVKQRKNGEVKISCHSCPEGMFSLNNGRITNINIKKIYFVSLNAD